MSLYIYISIFTAFIVSYLIRVLPLTLIRKPIKNRFIRSFLYYVPYITLAVMTFPAIIEALIMLFTCEILREADIRFPNNYGSAASILGALVLGEAAVAAGIVTPIVIIVVATTSISEIVFYDPDVIDAIREWRLLFILASTFIGIIGFLLIFIIFIARLASLECLGTPYLTPISPINIRSLKDSLIRVSRKNLKNRPTYLTNNLTRMGDIDEKDNI